VGPDEARPPARNDPHLLRFGPPRRQEAAGSSHHHDERRSGDLRRLLVASGLVVAFLVTEVVVGAISGSLAILADAAHMLTDAIALGAAATAVVAASRPASNRFTFGHARAEILSAALNGVLLVVAAALVLAGAIGRLVHPVAVDGEALVVVGSIGIAVNAVATRVVLGADRSSLNIGGALAHLVTDLWAYVATVAAGAVILATGWQRADAVASLTVVALMVAAAWPLLSDSGRILLLAAPEGMALEEVRTHLLDAPHVRDVHDLHAFVVDSHLPALSAHVVVEQGCFEDGHAPQVLDALQGCLVGHFDLEHSTFQLEPPGHAVHELGSHPGTG
jgi:cobalt-zinc-cadmium efflux system protein